MVPGRLLAGSGHGLAAGDDQLDAVVEAQRPAGDEGGVLAQAVAGAGRRCEPDALDGVEHHQAEHGCGQLGVLGLGELLNRGPEQQPGQVAAGRGRCLLDDFPRGVVDPRFTHSGAL